MGWFKRETTRFELSVDKYRMPKTTFGYLQLKLPNLTFKSMSLRVNLGKTTNKLKPISKDYRNYLVKTMLWEMKLGQHKKI
jgi:hypothetical protein